LVLTQNDPSPRPIRSFPLDSLFLSPNSAGDSATLNTPSAASNAPVYDGCIAAGLVGIAFAMLALLRGSAWASFTHWSPILIEQYIPIKFF
jgi:hypothetical protein